MRYFYSLVRFVPDPAKGEFINVAAIVGSEESSEWGVRQVTNAKRARYIDEHGALDAVWAFLDRVGHDIDVWDASITALFPADVELDEEWLQKLHTTHQNVVQLSPPAPMVAEDAEQALDMLFEEMIVDRERERREGQTKHAALAAARSAYKKHQIMMHRNLRERVALQTQSYNQMIDFAVVDAQVLQLTQTWSFQSPEPETQDTLASQVKAWGWTIRDVREAGGSVQWGDAGELPVEADVDIRAIVIPPLPNRDDAAWGQARAVFDTVEVPFVYLNQADSVGDEANKLLRKTA